MSVPVPIRPARPPELVRLQFELGLSHGDDFTACRKLLALIEAVAPCLSEVDRLQISRLLNSTGHAVWLTTDAAKRR